MPLYYFRLVDSNFVRDYGAHNLPSETEAQIAAIELARVVAGDQIRLDREALFYLRDRPKRRRICVIPLDVEM